MAFKRLLTGILTLLLAACSLTPAPVVSPSIPTPSPTLPAGDTPSNTLLPSETPSPTLTPEVRVANGDQDFFDGDYVQAQSEYQIALDASTDAGIRSAALWGLGRVEYQAGNYGKALEDLWNLANSFQENGNARRAYYLIGKIYFSLERYTEAAQAFSVFLALRPGILDAYVQEQRGDAFNAAGNYSEAISAYQAALDSPHLGDNTSLEIKLARAYVSSGDTTTALEKFTAITAATSNDYVLAQMDLLTGQLYLSLGQPEQAYQYFMDAVDKYPLSYDSYSALVALVNAGVTVNELNRGLVDYYAGQYGYAFDAFTRYIGSGLDVDGTAAYYSALCELKLGNYQAGVDQLSAFIDSFPNNGNWRSAWGEKADTQWSELNLYDDAAQTLQDYARADPDILFAPQALLSAGRIFEREGKLDQAASLWEGIADSYPGSSLVPEALFQAGIVHIRSGNNAQALLSFQRVLLFSDSADDQARALFWVGKTQLALGDKDSAKSAWQQAAGLDPTGYYSLRSQEMLQGILPFTPSPTLNLIVDMAAERSEAESWLRVTFNLPADTDLAQAGPLLSDSRLIRGTELWSMGLQDDARLEFEDLRAAVENEPANTYRLMNYMLDLGLYRPAVFAARQVLTLAGEVSQAQTLAAPRFFNHIRYGLYYQDIIAPAAHNNGFDLLFLYSVVRQESLFEGFVRSSAGARGLMQIVPATGQEISNNLGWPPGFTPDDLYRPVVSVTLGTNYLMFNRNRLDGDLYGTLASYNAGAASADVWRSLSGSDTDLFLEIIRFSETANYIHSIYENFYMYRLLYGLVP
jgi:soluble lytic murein transglycosylase